MRSKYNSLLDDIGIRRWYDNNARGSKVTADVYLRRLGSFCEANNLTPLKLVSLKGEKIEGSIMDYVTLMEKKGFAGSYIKSTVKAIKILSNNIVCLLFGHSL